MHDTLVVGDIIVADIIGEGFYEIVSFDDFYVNVKCLKLFGNGWQHRGHVTNCHHGVDKETGKRIPINLKKWLSYRRVTKPHYGYNMPLRNNQRYELPTEFHIDPNFKGYLDLLTHPDSGIKKPLTKEELDAYYEKEFYKRDNHIHLLKTLFYL